MMRTTVAVFVALAVLVVPLGLAASASAATTDTSRNVIPSVIGPIATNRFGGGMMVGVRAGQTMFGVFYGTSDHPNNVVIFAEETRVLGGADIVDASGEHLATRGIPVQTVLAQSLNRFIEFNTTNANAGINLVPNYTGLLVNIPVKALNLNTGAWTLSHMNYTSVGNMTTIELNVTATDLRYTWVSPLFNSTAQIGDGKLNKLAFDFHLVVTTQNKTLTLPWYKVTVSDGFSREITAVSFEGNRTISGPSVVMGAKYDHVIDGWDFANPGNRLALETHLIFGNYFPDRTVDFIHAAYYHDNANSGNDTWHEDANTVTDFTAPQIYTRDQIVFDDHWTRVGRFAWTSNVTVDGVQKTMRFQVQGGSQILLSHDGAIFQGFWVRAAFLYPAGRLIIHDPAMSVEAFMPNIASGFNLTPLGILLIQVAVVGVAIVPALYLRAKARRTPK
jgi:hypothetical protein